MAGHGLSRLRLPTLLLEPTQPAQSNRGALPAFGWPGGLNSRSLDAAMEV